MRVDELLYISFEEIYKWGWISGGEVAVKKKGQNRDFNIEVCENY